MKLTYWIADCRNDSACYSMRAKTRKACLAGVAANGGVIVTPGHCQGGDYTPQYDPPRKVTIQYDNGFDLIHMALGEGGIE